MKSTTHLSFQALIACALLLSNLLLHSCQKSDDSGATATLTFEAVIADAGNASETITEESTLLTTDRSYETRAAAKLIYCTQSRTFQHQSSSLSSGANPVLSAKAQAVFPGRMVKANSLTAASPAGYNIARGKADYTITAGNSTTTFSVDDLNPTNYQAAQTVALLNGIVVNPPSFETDNEEVFDIGGIAAFLGVRTHAYTSDLGNCLVPSSNANTTSYIVKVEKPFFTTSFTMPNSLTDFFAPEVTPAQLQTALGATPPAYLSEVTYGKAMYLLVESTDDPERVEDAVEAMCVQLDNNHTDDINLGGIRNLHDLQVKVLAFGGAAGNTQLDLDRNSLDAFKTLLGEPNVLPTAMPIRYEARSLDDNTPVERQLVHTVVEQTTFPATSTSMPFIRHWAGQLEDLLGPVGAAYNESGETIILISKDGTQAVRSTPDKLEGPFPVEDLFGGSIPFADGIGAACNIEGGDWSSATIMAVDMSGQNFAYWLGSSWTTPSPIAELGSGNGATNPLGSSGCGAIIFRSKNDQGPSSRYIFDAAGANYTFYKNSPSDFSPRYALRQWGTDDSCPFSTISAGVGMMLGQDWIVVHFDTEGDDMSVYEYKPAVNSTTFSIPFSL